MAQELSREEVFVCAADLKEGELRGQKIDGQWIMIVNHQGKYSAMDAACAHSGYPLFKGKLNEKGVVTCSLHYAQFNCRDGKVVSDPAICGDQIMFEVVVKEGKVFWLRAKAQEPKNP